MGGGPPKTGVAARGHVNGRGPAQLGGMSALREPVLGGSSSHISAPAVDPNFEPLPMTAFKVGMRIEHNRFGPGEILEITGNVPELKARVRFDELGEKLLLLKYAKMREEKKAK